MPQKTSKQIKRVAFFGDADLKSTDKTYKLAVETAKLLAESGYTIVDGGGPGIMMAATEGARLGGGEVEVVIIDPDKVPGNYEGTEAENLDMATKVIETSNITRRTAKLIEVADAFVIFKGGTGTLAEMSAVWEQAKFDYGHHEPVIFVGKDWKEIVDVIVKNMNFESKEKRVVETVETPEEVLRALAKAGS
ncbi:LOG family protein [Candidatus Shapirobacteria bacterium]|nr:LOG family protein [Candidatus Shapirobacteria bacterium]